jgi:glycosyltransferase involved in cell wall biosynthesis
VAVVPAYRVEAQIQAVLRDLPSFLTHVIVVDDASPDRTADLVRAAARRDRRILLLQNDKNEGVGGAMITGFRKALELDAQIIVKIDGDGQMDLTHLPNLVARCARRPTTRRCRFRDFAALRQMPLIRRGQYRTWLSAKAATGY